MRVAIISGSVTDKDIVIAAKKNLEYFDIPCDEFITSAHRSPNLTKEIALKVEEYYDASIVIAGLSAALPGILAAYTNKPVIGVPVASELMGLDALLSIAQMPAGVPVATMGIGKKGAKNAALFIVRLFALNDEALRSKLNEYKIKEENKLKQLNVT